MSDLYRQIILDHYKNPLNKGKLLSPDVVIDDANPLCGDNLEVYLKINDNTLKDISFVGKGCALSIATASILSDHIKGENIDKIKNLSREDVYALIGIDVSPARNKCVMLSLSAIKKGIFEFESKTIDNNEKNNDEKIMNNNQGDLIE